MMVHEEIIRRYESELHEPHEQEHWLDPEAFRRLRFVLVQESLYGGFWLTSHNTVKDAAAYHDGEEYAEDWPIIELHDTQTGDTYEAVTRTIFTRQRRGVDSVVADERRAGA